MLCCQATNCKLNITLLNACVSQIHYTQKLDKRVCVTENITTSFLKINATVKAHVTAQLAEIEFFILTMKIPL